MVAFKNSTGIKANSSFCTFRFPTTEARKPPKPFQYQPITTTSPTQPFAHFVFMPICGEGKCNADLVGGDVVVSKGSCFMYYWNHPFHATRISMRLGVVSILLALISIVIALLV